MTPQGALHTPEEAEVFFGALVENTTIQELDVSSCSGILGSPAVANVGGGGGMGGGMIGMGAAIMNGSGSSSGGAGAGNGGGTVNLSGYLSRARCLRVLDASYVIQTASECETLAMGVKYNTGLLTLILDGSAFASRRKGAKAAALQAFAHAVKPHKALKEVRLAFSTWIGNDGVELVPILSDGSSLQTLDVRGTDMAPNSLKVIINVAKQQAENLDLLLDEPFAKQLTNARVLHKNIVQLRNGDDVMDLNLKDRVTDDADAVKLFEALRTNHTVASLNLHGCELGMIALKSLGECLRLRKSGLSSLNLTSCINSPEGLYTILAGLKRNETVKYVNLHNCSVEDHAMKMLCDCLTTNITLLKLKGIPTNVASVLAPYLEINQTMAGDPCQSQDILFKCVRVGKHTAIPKLLSLHPNLLVEDKNGTLLHELLLEQEQPHFAELLAVFGAHWHFNNNVAEIFNASQTKFDVFRQVVLKLTDDDWVEKSSQRTVLHAILTECRSRFLTETQTMLLAREILAKKPNLNAAKDNSGETPAEIAAFCIQAPKIQNMFMMGIISALQRRGWELEASQQEIKVL